MKAMGYVAVMVLALAACSPSASGTDGASEEPSRAPAEPSAAASEGAASAPASGSGLRIVETSAGQALAGEDGLTLYIHTEEGTGEFVCVDDCLTNWPPLVAPVDAGEASADLLGTVMRPDGTEQVTYNGFPLYFFAGDSAEGDAAGDGLNGVWFIANPAGN
jgi:predicted lipoprotein with Yx(FWY)xxD motif